MPLSSLLGQVVKAKICCSKISAPLLCSKSEAANVRPAGQKWPAKTFSLARFTFLNFQTFNFKLFLEYKKELPTEFI